MNFRLAPEEEAFRLEVRSLLGTDGEGASVAQAERAAGHVVRPHAARGPLRLRHGPPS